MATSTSFSPDSQATAVLRWELDERTAAAATAYPLHIVNTTPEGPFKGRAFDPRKWNHRVVQPAKWPNGELRSDPEQIIQQFREQHYTQALALVVSWGTMWRQPDAIWEKRGLGNIESVLHVCSASIQKSESITDSWKKLTGRENNELAWPSVLTSKTLHFLCLSLGFDHNPPVPIDGAVIRQRVWPAFRNPIPKNERPDNWEGNSFDAYNRYMTAIVTWADQKHWTTAEVETTISLQFQAGWDRFSSQ